jgi:hypothetical protein
MSVFGLRLTGQDGTDKLLTNRKRLRAEQQQYEQGKEARKKNGLETLVLSTAWDLFSVTR